jgi:hypothetical protein
MLAPISLSVISILKLIKKCSTKLSATLASLSTPKSPDNQMMEPVKATDL